VQLHQRLSVDPAMLEESEDIRGPDAVADLATDHRAHSEHQDGPGGGTASLWSSPVKYVI